MALSVENITFDSTDPDRLAEWWARAVDGTVNALAPGFFVTVDSPRRPGLAFQKVDDPTPGKNRVHIDFSAADSRQRSSGWSTWAPPRPAAAKRARSSDWVVFADPDGNAFCVAGGDVAAAT